MIFIDKEPLEIDTELFAECDKLYQQIKRTHQPYFSALKARLYTQSRENSRKVQAQRRFSQRPSTSMADIEKAFDKYMSASPKATRVDKPLYPQHNRYSQYSLIKVSQRWVDQYTRSFPVLKWYKEENYRQKAIQVYDEIKNFFQEGKNTKSMDNAWRKCRNRWIWCIDIEQATYLLLVMRNMGIESIDWIQHRYGGGLEGQGVTKDVIYEKLMGLDNNFRNLTTIHRNLRVSVDSKEKINETTITRTSKELFCVVCMTYDCEDHKLEEIAYEKDCRFCHPDNLITREQHLEKAVTLMQDFDCIQQSTYVTGMRCSQHCYRNLTSQNYHAYFQKNQPFLSPVVTALVKLGIQLFSYDPCSLFLMTGTDTTCALIFIYLFEDFNLRQTVKLNNYDSQVNDLANQLFVECSIASQNSDKRKKPTKKQKKLKELHSSKLNTIPICVHYFFGEDIPTNGEFCTDCACQQRGFCIPVCQCDPTKCTKQRSRCNCKDQCLKDSCACYKSNMECDPSLCGCVKSQSKHAGSQLLGCNNMQIQLGKTAKLRIGNSTIPDSGLGVFAGQDISKNHLVVIYKGQIIDQDTQSLRQLVSCDNHFYTFAFKNGAIDAKYIGNKARFINHDNYLRENVRVEIKFSDVDYYLCLFAMRDIQLGEELFFNYDGEGIIYENLHDKYPYIRPRPK